MPDIDRITLYYESGEDSHREIEVHFDDDELVTIAPFPKDDSFWYLRGSDTEHYDIAHKKVAESLGHWVLGDELPKPLIS